MKQYERRVQVARAIQKEIGSLIQKGGIKDDRMARLVSVVDVDLNSSLSSAKVIYSVLSGEDDEVSLMGTDAALRESSGYIRGVIGRKLNLKYAPRLYFIHSDSLSKSVEMVNLIDRTVESDEASHIYNKRYEEEE
jgi:ribosome-binding factor A